MDAEPLIAEPKPGPGSPCPACKRPRDPKLRCWWCHDRPCVNVAVCGRMTGGAFFPHCIGCQPRDEVLVADGPGEPATAPRRWVLVLEARPGGPPMAVLVRRLVKYGSRYLGLNTVALPNDLPAGTRSAGAIEEEAK